MSKYTNVIQDVIELRDASVPLEQPDLSGYLWKRSPNGLIRPWKRRFFALQVRKQGGDLTP